jgi:hypothetical protein
LLPGSLPALQARERSVRAAGLRCIDRISSEFPLRLFHSFGK